MSKKIYWSELKTDDMERIKLTFEDFFKILDCYYGNIFVTDGDGNTLYFNDFAELGAPRLGLTRKEHLGKHVSYFLEQGIFTRSVTMEVLRTKGEVMMESVDYAGRPFWVRAIPVFDDDDNIMMTIHYSQYQEEISRFLEEIEINRTRLRQISGVLEYYSKNIGKDMKLIYKSNKMSQIIREAQKVAKTDGAILIGGESGTGKELLARYVFNESNRNKEVFLPINCAAIPNELIESELFGYMPGAFTGASKGGKIGVFELANKGTIFLDEVGELPLHVQSKLLRVLELGEVSRIGATSTTTVDIRIIAATNRNLQDMVKRKTFREDLYFRLNVIPLVMPSLRERPEDIPILANYYLGEYNSKYQVSKAFSDTCLRMFMDYKWPGNVRELKNMIHRMVIITEENIIEPFELKTNCPVSALYTQKNFEYSGDDLRTALQRLEREYINQAIKASEGNITHAAEKLGVHRTYIYRKLKNK